MRKYRMHVKYLVLTPRLGMGIVSQLLILAVDPYWSQSGFCIGCDNSSRHSMFLFVLNISTNWFLLPRNWSQPSPSWICVKFLQNDQPRIGGSSSFSPLKRFFFFRGILPSGLKEPSSYGYPYSYEIKWPRVSQPRDSNLPFSNLCRRDLRCRHLQSSGGAPRAADECHIEIHGAGDPFKKLGMS